MTLKSQSDYRCPQCSAAWLPFQPGLNCPSCKRPVPDGEVTAILNEALESARFNVRLYGRFELEFWTTRTLGDRYLQFGFKAIQVAADNPAQDAQKTALAALLDLNLEDLAPLRQHVHEYLTVLVERFRKAQQADPDAWKKIPDPEKPFFGRKIIDS